MKNMLKYGVTGALFLGLLGLFSVANAADGKQLYLDQKCNKCHAFKDIAKLPKEAGAAEEAEDGDDAGIEAPDLKVVATDDQVQKAPGGAAKYLKDYLMKLVDHKAKDNVARKHKKQFKGADADLAALVDYLLK